MSFPKYPAYKSSGIEWLGNIPEHWSATRLRFLAAINPTKQEVRHLPETTAVTFLPMEAIGEDGSLKLDQEKTIGECLAGYTYFKEGDIGFAKITPCFENGKGAIFRNLLNEIGFGTTELIIARANKDKTTPEFLNYIFRSSFFRKYGEAEMYGAGGQKRVPESFVENFYCPLPSIHEQRLIADFLDRETKKIDALIAEQQRLIELLQEKRQAVISHAVTKGLNPDAPMKDSGVEWLGQVPAHWEICPLKWLARCSSGKSLDMENNFCLESDDDHPIPVFGGNGIMGYCSSPLISEPVLAVGRVGALCGNLHLVSNRSWITDNALILRCLTNILSLSYTREVLTIRNLNEIASKTAQPLITGSQLLNERIPVPSLEEQEKIVDSIKIFNAETNALVDTAQKSIFLLKERRSALISAAVTGQIDVRGLAGAVA